MIQDTTKLFQHPVFKQSIKDIESLGLRVVVNSESGAMPYAFVGGRSNARWWLIPLSNNHVTATGFAMFQPLLISSRIIKSMVVFLSYIGLSKLWVTKKIYISGLPCLQQYFSTETPLSFAFFTGTDSPHRKLAVQVMDNAGNIKGYAKVSRNPLVQALLQHEANTLNYVKTLNLQTANIPNVLFSGALGKACALVTDTLKTPKTKSVTELQKIHLDFLQELADKTKADVHNNPDWLIDSLRGRFKKLETKLTPEWKARLEKAITAIGQQKKHMGPPVMAHGDFTPSNTFVANDKLYVFDWEYADNKSSVSYDVIHFLLACSEMQKFSIQKQIANVLNRICLFLSIRREAALIHFMTYLCIHAMQYAQREAKSVEIVYEWGGQHETAQLIDALLNGEIK